MHAMPGTHEGHYFAGTLFEVYGGVFAGLHEADRKSVV